MHLGFIDQWYLINPAAVIGVAIGYFWPSTKFPHSGHVLLSTWASLFHVIMALGVAVYWYAYVVICIFLFIAVWLPCCISDIVFSAPVCRQGRQKKNLPTLHLILMFVCSCDERSQTLKPILPCLKNTPHI